MSDPVKSRSHEHEIAIEAPIEAVWEALTDAAELMKWYVADARIDPRVGGKYWISWGEGMDGLSVIEAFDAPHRLRLALQPPEGTEPGMAEHTADLERPIIEEFTLESRDGATVLRLVNSGIPATKGWDDFYEGTQTGWDSYLRGLRNLLEGRTSTPDAGALQSPRYYMEHLPERVDPEAAQGFEAVVQYEISGTGGGRWVVSVRDGAVEVREGVEPKPTATFEMTAEDYVALASGRLSGRDAYAQGKLRVRGNAGFLPMWGAIFRR